MSKHFCIKEKPFVSKIFKMAESARVLSIQSHIVHGYVGNKCATFSLQVLGFEVDPINTVHYSNHTGRSIVKGQILTENELRYVPTSTLLLRIVDLIKHLKSINPNLIYVCDPVMGDDQKLYVPEALVPIYKNFVVPLADIVIPNQYETELLTDKKISSLSDVQECINVLHEKGPKVVILSSFQLGNNNSLLSIASLKHGDLREELVIEIPRISGSYTGTGDLFAALFLAWMYKTNNCLKESLEKTIATLQAILKRTFNNTQDRGDNEEHTELQLIQSKDDIENPKVEIRARRNSKYNKL
ncbi:pyridoxal kinase-like isoform X4 [Agrilus planipennis]|uniref:Pyridoxal kinase n=1 Tax=Agrilus planipennis TaxID=224129 RepID=A0A7F5QZ59_AGRPL|nr:pyridoxal kinase-like isoform X4 [Agrilus planipennis]